MPRKSRPCSSCSCTSSTSTPLLSLSCWQNSYPLIPSHPACSPISTLCPFPPFSTADSCFLLQYALQQTYSIPRLTSNHRIPTHGASKAVEPSADQRHPLNLKQPTPPYQHKTCLPAYIHDALQIQYDALGFLFSPRRG